MKKVGFFIKENSVSLLLFFSMIGMLVHGCIVFPDPDSKFTFIGAILFGLGNMCFNMINKVNLKKQLKTLGDRAYI